jgi:hypothetical protein
MIVIIVYAAPKHWNDAAATIINALAEIYHGELCNVVCVQDEPGT